MEKEKLARLVASAVRDARTVLDDTGSGSAVYHSFPLPGTEDGALSIGDVSSEEGPAILAGRSGGGCWKLSLTEDGPACRVLGGQPDATGVFGWIPEEPERAVREVCAILYEAGLVRGRAHRLEAAGLTDEEKKTIEDETARRGGHPGFFWPGTGFGLPGTESFEKYTRLEADNADELLRGLQEIFYISANTVEAGEPEDGEPRYVVENARRGEQYFDFIGRNYGVIEYGWSGDHRILSFYLFNPDLSFGEEGINTWGIRSLADGKGRVDLWEIVGRTTGPDRIDREHILPGAPGADFFTDILSSVFPYCARSQNHKGPFRRLLEEMPGRIDVGAFAEKAIEEAAGRWSRCAET